jgi:hypothetical protein
MSSRYLVIALLMAGCGSDGTTDPPPCEGVYCGPESFTRDGCDQGVAPVSTGEVNGVWHLDAQFLDGSYPGAMRIDPAEGGGRTGFLFGAEVDSVELYTDDLFVRREWITGEDTWRLHALDACALLEDGSMFGHLASCYDDECAEATVRLFPLAALDEPVAAGITEVSQFAGDPAWPVGDGVITINVQHHAGMDYVARYGDGLRIVDVTDPAAPRDRGHSPVEHEFLEIYNDVKIVDMGDGTIYALAASNLRGVVVIDVSDPDAPTEVVRFPVPTLEDERPEIHTLFLDGTRAYLANTGRGSLQIYDIADPTAPVRLGEWFHPNFDLFGGFVHDLYVEAGRAYLNYWNLGMAIVDTQDDPANPTLVGTFDQYDRRKSHSSWVTTAGGRKVAVHGDEDFGAHVRVVDVDDQGVAFLDVLAEWETRPEVSVHNIMAVGELAFVTYYQDGLRVLDLADPTHPVEIAHYRTWDPTTPFEELYGRGFYEGAIGVDHDAETGLLHVVDTHRGLFVLQLDE